MASINPKETKAQPTTKDGVYADVDTEYQADDKENVVATTARVLDHPAERALCWKFDIRILPVLAIMCTWLPPLTLSLRSALTINYRPLQCARQGS